jgi:hypothetical protein
MDTKEKIILFGIFLVILTIITLIATNCNSNNETQIRCEQKGGVYRGFYKSKGLCFSPSALIDSDLPSPN